MTTISIIGSGTMATAVAGRVAKAGNAVEVINRDAAKGQALASKLQAGAATGTYGAVPAGDIVILAVPYGSVAAVVADFGDALDGKVIIDLANPVNADMTGLVIRLAFIIDAFDREIIAWTAVANAGISGSDVPMA